jgi:hypothetical protein
VSFLFDVFVSYSSADRDWANKVQNILRSSGQNYSIFFDYQSLRAGDDWESKIQSSLENSRSLVLIWSEHAKTSDWVTRELWSFVSRAKLKENPDRRVIVINLQGFNRATNAYQQISRPELQRAYANGSAPSAAEWQQASAEIYDGLNPDKKPLSVPLVALTLTLAEFEGLGSQLHARIYRDFKLAEKFLKARYGRARQDWKPYAGSQPITGLLEKIQSGVNAALKTHRIEWRQPDEPFWTHIPAAKKFVNDDFNTSVLSVLIIDPVAVYHIDVLQRLMLFQDSLVSDRRVIVTLPPFGVPPRLIRLREALANRATPYFDDYFQPAVPPKRKLSAQCAWNVTDVEDIKRHILAAAGYLGAGPDSKEALPPYLRQGQRE